jgi:hypothetical protein
MIYDQMKHPYVDPGIYMTHPELSERVMYILQTARETNTPIRRKTALNLLRPSVQAAEGQTVLLLDGVPVWSLPDGEESRSIAAEASRKIDEVLQMETAPFEIQVIVIDGRNALRVGPSLVAREPLPKGTQPLHIFREALVQSLGEARNKHQGAKYLR